MVALVAWTGTAFADELWPFSVDTANTQSISNWRNNYVFEKRVPPIAKIKIENHSKEQIEDLIWLKSEEQGISGNLMVKIARCESGLSQKWNYLNDTNPNYYTAYGLFQIIEGHELTYGINRMTLEGNIELALELYKDKGTQPWKLSSKCWQD